MVVFVIMGKTEPVYELDALDEHDELAYLHQFILHASLDMLYSVMWSNNATFLRVIDRFNNAMISSYITPGGSTFLLLHNGKSEDSIRAFFIEAQELFAKYMLNPFSSFDSPIISSTFDAQMKMITKKFL